MYSNASAPMMAMMTFTATPADESPSAAVAMTPISMAATTSTVVGPPTEGRTPGGDQHAPEGDVDDHLPEEA